MNRRLLPVALAAGLLLITTTAHPAAAGPKGLSEQAKQAASLDDLKASDSELTKAITDLDIEVKDQQEAVEEAQQSLDASSSAAEANEKALNETQARIIELQQRVTQSAIDEYVQPNDDFMGKILDSDGIGDASTRSAYLHVVDANAADALEELRSAKKDLAKESEAALEARKLSEDRKQAAEKKLDDLNAARKGQERLAASLQERIKSYAEEDAASARINTSSEPERASRSAGRDEGIGSRADGKFQWPLANHKVNSPFGTRWGRLHAGVDLQAKIGTAVYAAKAGTVTQAGWESGYGQYTCIDHGAGLSTCYAHQSRFGVKVGDVVSQGQLIGYSGNTGSSQGAHLHFETRLNGVPRDPMQYLDK